MTEWKNPEKATGASVQKYDIAVWNSLNFVERPFKNEKLLFVNIDFVPKYLSNQWETTITEIWIQKKFLKVDIF